MQSDFQLALQAPGNGQIPVPPSGFNLGVVPAHRLQKRSPPLTKKSFVPGHSAHNALAWV
jgi:hypothetical protein